MLKCREIIIHFLPNTGQNAQRFDTSDVGECQCMLLETSDKWTQISYLGPSRMPGNGTGLVSRKIVVFNSAIVAEISCEVDE